MKTAAGFTVVETLVMIILLGIAATVGANLFEAVRMTHRDQDRKVAINTIHHNLQEVARPKLGGYPRVLSAAALPAMDGALLKDPAGALIATQGSDYRYEPTGCGGGDICQGYTLRADLEREPDFVKTSQQN